MEDGVTTTTKVGGELPKGGTGWLIQESNKEDLKEDLDEDMCDVSSWEFHY